MDYGKAIKTVRSLKSVSQVELSDRAQVGKSYLSKIESGSSIPTLETLEKIADALEVPLYALTFFASEKKDLSGISAKEADEVKKHLFDMIMSMS